MSIADEAQVHALLIDGQDVRHVVFGLTGAPRKEWYDAVSTPE